MNSNDYALKWFKVRNGRLVGGSMRDYPFRKGTWQTRKFDPYELRLCSRGYHVLVGNNFPAYMGDELWCVAVRGHGPADHEKRVVCDIKPMFPVATAKMAREAREKMLLIARDFRVESATVGARVAVLIGGDRYRMRLAMEKAMIDEMRRTQIVGWMSASLPTHGRGSYREIRRLKEWMEP